MLSIETISYLTFEGIRAFEELELAIRDGSSDINPKMRRMHLLVTAIYESIQALEAYSKFTHLSEANKEYLNKVRRAVSTTECNYFVYLYTYILKNVTG